MRNLNFIISDYLYMVRMMRRDQRRLNEVKRTKARYTKHYKRNSFHLEQCGTSILFGTYKSLSSDCRDYEFRHSTFVCTFFFFFFLTAIIRHY